MKELMLENDAPWKQRYRAKSILWSQIAKGAPTRGLVCSNVSGVYQLHSWDVRTGALVQLTHEPDRRKPPPLTALTGATLVFNP